MKWLSISTHVDLLVIILHFTRQLQGLQQDCTALYLAQWLSGSLLEALNTFSTASHIREHYGH